MTAQISDNLDIDGVTWFIKRDLDVHPIPMAIEKTYGEAAGIHLSTACRRGYIAKWKIQDDCFYLCDVEGKYANISNGPILADWIDLEIPVARGEVMEYIHLGYASRFEEESCVYVYKGNVVTCDEWVKSGGFFRRLFTRAKWRGVRSR